MKSWTIEIPGPIVAYTRTTQRAKFVSPAYRKYAAWKKRVRLHATVAGVPEVLEKTREYSVKVFARWKRRPRQDISNVLKGIEDSLWKEDRYVFKVYGEHIPGSPDEDVTVIVEEM